DDNELTEISAGQVRCGQKADIDAEILQRRRHVISTAGNVADFQIGCDLDIHAGSLVSRRVVKEIGAQTRITSDVIAFAVFFAAVLCDGGDFVWFLTECGRKNLEPDRLVLTIFRGSEWL